MRRSHSLSSPSALASFEESLQVATSPCCWRNLPDVISANPSLRAWAPVTAAPGTAPACFFLHLIALPPYPFEARLPRFPSQQNSSRHPFSPLPPLPTVPPPHNTAP